MNTPQKDGIVRHVLNTLGAVALTLGTVGLLPANVKEVLTVDNVEVIKASVLVIVGATSTIWAIFKSKKAPEKQVSEEKYQQLVSELKSR